MAALVEGPSRVNVAPYGYTILSDPPNAKLEYGPSPFSHHRNGTA
jgi:hypothetical protein